MNIEEAKKIVRGLVFNDDGTMVSYIDFTSADYDSWNGYTLEEYAKAIETLLTAYEKEKEKNKLQPDCAEPIERTEEMVNMRWVNHRFISKDKIKEILGIEEETDNEKILSLLQTIVDENARLEDIEDKKVQIEYNNVFNKGVKSVEDKIKVKIEEQDETKQYWTDEVKDILKSLLKKE